MAINEVPENVAKSINSSRHPTEIVNVDAEHKELLECTTLLNKDLLIAKDGIELASSKMNYI